MAIKLDSGWTLGILGPITVLLLGFLGRSIYRWLFKSLSETHASEGRNAISDAMKILNQVETDGGMTSSRPWHVAGGEIHYSDIKLHLQTLDQRAKDRKLSTSLEILQSALLELYQNSVAPPPPATYISLNYFEPQALKRAERENVRSERQLVQLDIARPEIQRLFDRMSVLERRGVRR